MLNDMSRISTGIALAASFAATSGLAGALAANGGDTPAGTATATCLKAEVNPVTGHVLCIDPLGAPVAPPPSVSEVPCKPDGRTGQAWSYGSRCKS